MTEQQRLKIEGLDMLLKNFNKYPDNKVFTVAEIIEKSNAVYQQIMHGKTEQKPLQSR